MVPRLGGVSWRALTSKPSKCTSHHHLRCTAATLPREAGGPRPVSAIVSTPSSHTIFPRNSVPSAFCMIPRIHGLSKFCVPSWHDTWYTFCLPFSFFLLPCCCGEVFRSAVGPHRLQQQQKRRQRKPLYVPGLI